MSKVFEVPLKFAQYASIHNIHKGRKATSKIPDDEVEEFHSIRYKYPILYEYFVNKGLVKDGEPVEFRKKGESTGEVVDKITTSYLGEKARVKTELPPPVLPPAPDEREPKGAKPISEARKGLKSAPQSETGAVAPAPLVEVKPPEEKKEATVVSDVGAVAEVPVWKRMFKPDERIELPSGTDFAEFHEILWKKMKLYVNFRGDVVDEELNWFGKVVDGKMIVGGTAPEDLDLEKEDDTAFEPFPYKGETYYINARGDVVNQDYQWVGVVKGDKLIKGGEPPDYLKEYVGWNPDVPVKEVKKPEFATEKGAVKRDTSSLLADLYPELPLQVREDEEDYMTDTKGRLKKEWMDAGYEFVWSESEKKYFVAGRDTGQVFQITDKGKNIKPKLRDDLTGLLRYDKKTNRFKNLP